MNSLKQLKWYHIVMLILLGVLLFLLISRSKCIQNMWKNASESFDSTDTNNTNKQTDQEKSEDKIKGEIILYYATWCGNCKSFSLNGKSLKIMPKQTYPMLEYHQ